MYPNRFVFVFTWIVLATNAVAQFDFFWSPHDLHQGALNADVTYELNVGESGSLFLYVWTGNYAKIGPGAFIDIETSESGIIEFTDAESFDFSINIGDIPIGTRWLNPDGSGGSAGHTGQVSADLINEWHAFTVSNEGIRESNNGSGPFLDQGYDAGADAFLFGRIDFSAVGTGSMVLIMGAGDGGIVSGGKIVDPAVGQATIIVTDSVLLGDINLDGFVNLADVDPFVQLLASGGFQLEADINQDGLFNSLDIVPFVDLLTP